MWLPISTYPITDNEFKDGPLALLYDPTKGILMGYGTEHYDGYDSVIEFRYDRDGLECEPTHWMPLPEAPMHPLYMNNTQQTSLY